MSHIYYRKAAVTDANGIAKVHVKTWQATYSSYMSDEILEQFSVPTREKQWEQWLSSQDSSTYIATENEKTIGFISFGKNRDDDATSNEAEIYAIYVDPDYWRKDIGNHLMNIALSEIAKKNFSNVSLWMLEANKQGKSFYEKCGFSKTSKEQTNPYFSSVASLEVQYRKFLSNAQQPLGSYEYMADAYAKIIDTKPIHVYYERPNTWALLPDKLKGLNILDVGCGSGWYAEQLLNAKCTITAIDASQRMVDLTSKRLKAQGRCIKANLEEPLDFLKKNEFDIVLAPLVIHYIKEWRPLFKEFARVLKQNGLLIFSTHQPHTVYQNFKLDNYFHEQIIKDHWNEPNVDVQYYHHTLHELTESLFHAGFLIERMIEPAPLEGLKQNAKMYDLITHQPWFLFVRAVKNANFTFHPPAT